LRNPTISPELVVSAFLFALAAAITPGPNNVFLMSSGANFGIRLSLPLLAGVCFGFPLMFLAIGLGLGSLFQQFPTIHLVITVIGVVYLTVLAWKIANAGAPEEKQNTQPITFLQSAGFQWVNPKAWIMATGAIAAFTRPADDMHWQVIQLTLVFMLAAIPSAWTWLLFGVGLQKLLKDPRNLRIFNLAMAMLLILSMVPVVLDLVDQLS
tara:strand:- start:3453 stop:4082 length:630 start_codon:yes stop_codon:yes gene_type:complete